MMTTIRRTLTLSTALFALQLAACTDGPLAPDSTDAEPQFLLGGSPLVPFWLAKAPVLETKQSRTGQVLRELIAELYMDAREADALQQGKRDFQSATEFSVNGDAVALGDPHPSPVRGMVEQKDGTMLVVIATPIDDATWSRIDAGAESGESVGIIMDMDLVDPDANGGVRVIHSVQAAGSFTK